MKVLIIHQHFKTPYSGGAIRSYYLAQALLADGLDVEVITAHHGDYKMEVIDGALVHYLNVPYNNGYGFLRRSVSFLRFLWKAVDKAKGCKDVALCYAISVPLTVGLAAMRIKKNHNIPFVFEVGDLWPDAPVEMGFVRNYFLRKYLYDIEKRIYQSAQAIVALSPPIKRAIEQKIPGKQIDVVPNMADTEFFVKSSKDGELVRKYNVAGKFVVSYIGALGLANGLDHIVHCAEATRKAGLPVQFILCGEGAQKQNLILKSKKLELHNITFLDLLSREGVKEILGITDAAFISYKPVKILETGSPNKFFDALAAGKLILINFGGWIKNEIEENNCGVFVDPFQPVDFVRKIKPFLADPLLLENFQFNARSLAEKKYSRKELSARFSGLIAEQVKNQDHRLQRSIL